MPAPGGWAWTHLPGGVPDADDTAGAIIALDESGASRGHRGRHPLAARLAKPRRRLAHLLSRLGKLPFDRSAPDLTAHALRALSAAVPRPAPRPLRRGNPNGLNYLAHARSSPTALGDRCGLETRHAPGQANPVLGTSRTCSGAGNRGSPTARWPPAACNICSAARMPMAAGAGPGRALVPGRNRAGRGRLGPLGRDAGHHGGHFPRRANTCFACPAATKGRLRSVSISPICGIPSTSIRCIWTIEALGRARRIATLVAV